MSHRHSEHLYCKHKSTFARVHCMQNFILFAFLFENVRIRFDEFSNDQFLARKNVKKTTSSSLFWETEMIHFHPVRIDRRQYKYLENHFRGTNNLRILVHISLERSRQSGFGTCAKFRTVMRNALLTIKTFVFWLINTRKDGYNYHNYLIRT